MQRLVDNTHVVDTWDDFVDLYENRGGGFDGPGGPQGVADHGFI